MNEGLALQIRVDKRAYHTNLGQAEPRGNVLGLVLEKESYAVAFLEAESLEEEICYFVAVVFDLDGQRKVKRVIVFDRTETGNRGLTSWNVHV